MGRSYQTLPQNGGMYQQENLLEQVLQAFVNFMRVRLLNFAVAGLLTVVYLLYQYGGLLFPPKQEDDALGARIPRSRSRSTSREREWGYKKSGRHSNRRHGNSRRYDRDYDR